MAASAPSRIFFRWHKPKIPPKGGVRESLVFGTGSGLYGNHIFSVYPVRPRSPELENRSESPSNRAYTENSWFPYSAFPDCVLKGFVARAVRLYEQEPGDALASARLGLYVKRWGTYLGTWPSPLLPNDQTSIADAHTDRQHPHPRYATKA